MKLQKAAIFSAAVLIWCAVGSAVFAADTITTVQPEITDGTYQISNKEELYWFADYVNTSTGNSAANAVLTADITVNEGDLSSSDCIAWTPIGKNGNFSYSGCFDGQGHTVSGLYYDDTSTSSVNVGFVGYSNGADISNINIKNTYFSVYNYVGGICGYAKNSSVISGCSFDGTVSAANTDAGGICGRLLSSSAITSCSNYGTISSSTNTGGICAYASSCTISGCVNNGTADGSSEYTGGICAYSSSSTIELCENYADISGSKNVGGICGYVSGSNSTNGSLTNCLNMGTITGSSYTAGIVGKTYNMYIKVRYCYSTGAVTCSGSYTGGILGNYYTANTVKNCYYLTGTASGGANGSDVSGKAEIKTADQFAGGEAAYLLNNSSSESPVWYQSIGYDAYPTLDSTHGIVSYDSETDSYSYTLKYDVNKDGAADKADAAAVLKYISGISTDIDEAAADADSSGKIEITDAVTILKSIN